MTVYSKFHHLSSQEHATTCKRAKISPQNKNTCQKNNTVLSITEDKTGNLWFGTSGGGVSRYDGKSFTNFTIDPQTTTLSNPIISFSDLSSGADFWNWNFGNGSDSSVISNPSPFIYPDTGSYIITLITSTLFNCFDTAYQTIIIEPDFVFFIPNSFTPDGDWVNDTFTPLLSRASRSALIDKASSLRAFFN